MIFLLSFLFWKSLSQCEVIANETAYIYTITGENCTNEILEQFQSNDNITAITIQGLREFPEYGFANCSNLQTVNFVNVSISYLSNYLFSRCYKLNAININNISNIYDIGKGVFSNCISLTEITLPDTIARLFDGVFQGCSNLSIVNLSNNLNRIDRNCFRDCRSLTEITLPSSLSSIGNSVFEYCISLTSIIIPCDLSLSDSCFKDCWSLTNITLPDSIKISQPTFFTTVRNLNNSNSLHIVNQFQPVHFIIVQI